MQEIENLKRMEVKEIKHKLDSKGTKDKIIKLFYEKHLRPTDISNKLKVKMPYITKIQAITNTGLFNKANEAKQKSENAQELENATLADYENNINKIIDGTTREDSSSKGKILWENSNSETTFAAQTVELSDNLENYDSIKKFFRFSITSGGIESSSVECLVLNNKISTILEYSFYAGGWSGHPLIYRAVNGENNKVYFDIGYTSGSGSNNVANNNVIVPCYIIGYKF